MFRCGVRTRALFLYRNILYHNPHTFPQTFLWNPLRKKSWYGYSLSIFALLVESRAFVVPKPEGSCLVWYYFHSQTFKWKFPASPMSNSHTPGTLFSLANLGEEACQITPPCQLALRPLPVGRPLP
jgi:hypothetical protein